MISLGESVIRGPLQFQRHLEVETVKRVPKAVLKAEVALETLETPENPWFQRHLES